MVKGINEKKEHSIYTYNGLGALVENIWVIEKNAYGYHDVKADIAIEGEIRHKASIVVKEFVVDYTSKTYEPLMEYETNGLDYRYVYGNDRLSVDIKGVANSSGNIIENGDHIRLYYHMDYLGTADYLTSPISQKVVSWTHYNEWGEITHNAVLKSGQRQLDLVKRYGTHDYDSVLDMYYAKARFYDVGDRRFTAMDPLKGTVADPQSMVQYLYVKNNPLVYIDEDGEIFALVTGAIGAAAGAYKSYKSTGKVSAKALKATQIANTVTNTVNKVAEKINTATVKVQVKLADVPGIKGVVTRNAFAHPDVAMATGLSGVSTVSGAKATYDYIVAKGCKDIIISPEFTMASVWILPK